MTDRTQAALAVVREALSRYTDAQPGDMQLDTALPDIQIDSLTLAELLFELEDRLNTTIPETTAVPRRVGDLVALVEPLLLPAPGEAEVAPVFSLPNVA